MKLPTPDLPRSGSRLHWPGLAGSADSALLAQTARLSSAGVTVIAASPLDAQRMATEIAWFDSGLRVCLLPDWETLPYDPFSPHPDLVSERLDTLYRVSRRDFDVLLTAATTALYRLAPRSYLAAHAFKIRRHERLDLDKLREQLLTAGYSHVQQVLAPGEYALRGGLIDLFPSGSALPFRIDLLDAEIETIKTFDIDSQRSLYPVPEIHLLPAREFPMDETGRSRFRSRFRERFEGDPSRTHLYKDVSNGIAPAGIEYYLPLFFSETETLIDYLPADSLLVLHGAVDAAIDEFWRDARERHRLLGGDRSRPVLPPDELFLDAEQFFRATHAFARCTIRSSAAESTDKDGTEAGALTLPTGELAIDRRAEDPLHRLRSRLQTFPGRVLIVAESPGRRETIAEMLALHKLPAEPCNHFADWSKDSSRLAITIGPLAAGFRVADDSALIVTETELYATAPRLRQRRRDGRASPVEGWLRDLTELKIGDPVVHIDHGIGRYHGLRHLDLGEGETEFLELEYAGGDRLYVPVSSLHLIQRYSGLPSDEISLHKLGSGQWEKAKREAAQQVRDTAAELLALYAQRSARAGHAFSYAEQDYEAFAAGFGFDETNDQAAAIEATLADMRSGKPMDRLICGDVGFGKTEVALRATFAAVMGGRQVAVLTPTTLLAEQHFQTFRDRFADWPVRIVELSRFRSAREQAQALAELAAGRCDIVIGTHRLLQSDVRFARLGLVIVDEEHRFGVRQKERLKSLRAEVDLLTLTATPIPRTLGMALEGLRDISVITTAPARRLAIKTFVRPWSRATIREAVLREFKRGGQVYYLYNEVDTIERTRAELEALLPEARIVVGHGQMPERELERVMREFTQQRANLLLCSTIIETGIDIATANTIIIDRADRLGLAQLHQLRGRVGRSHHQAYAYLLVDAAGKPTAQAARRLEAIQSMEELGSGFYLAMHDLEIRGAGELLGENQSGEMQQVGFALYTDLLKQAIRDLQSGREPNLDAPLAVIAEVNLHLPALLPDDYCPDVHERLVLYKRMAHSEDDDSLARIREELIDRFGALPPPTRVLLATHGLRLRARALGIAKIDANDNRVQLVFRPDTPVDPGRIIALMQNDRTLRLTGSDKLVWQEPSTDLDGRLAATRALLARIDPDKTKPAARRAALPS
ncbi:MAG: transcription-repair-coupling factor [Betaproteobacteria bacterium]